MSKDNFTEASAYLKQALPLMIKYQIPTTPTNYAVWYTYVAQRNPGLSQAIDDSIRQQGHCSAHTSERLYQQHVADESSQSLEQTKLSLEAMLLELGATMADTLSDTGQFQQVLENSFAKLSRFESEGLSIEETTGLVRELIQGSRDISQSTRLFSSQLAEANTEIAELKQSLAKSRELAYQDALTGLLNRRAFDEALRGYLANESPFSLVLMDIDHFKRLNDQYGHLFGDQVLKALSRRLSEACKEGEAAYRIGGEELCLLLPKRNLTVARQFAEALRRAIERLSIMDKRSGERVSRITASFGVTEYRPGDDYETLMRRVDDQLYKAKALGRNRVMPMSL